MHDESPVLIYAYTRGQTLADGAMIQIHPQVSAAAGFRLPVAFTVAAWGAAVGTKRTLGRGPAPRWLRHAWSIGKPGASHELLDINSGWRKLLVALDSIILRIFG